MSRDGSCCGHGRDNSSQIGPDGWAIAPGPSRPTDKAGDFSGFGKIAKSGGPMAFGYSSVFSTKSKDGKPHESSRTTEDELEHALDAWRRDRNANVDLSHDAPVEPTQRRKLYLIPRSKLLAVKQEESSAPHPEDKEGEEGENREKAESSISKEQSEKKIDQNRAFFAIRNLDEAEDHFTVLSTEHHHMSRTLHLTESMFARIIREGPAELLDDTALDAAKAFDLMVIMMEGAKLDKERRTPIASKFMDDDKPLSLSA
ncbi:hypothetical protein DFH11DRAFT_1763000 [Phellopilus nigrolimitatus]|nr:hypothetical protein DFH11DRAFT_1763000 [Phellopilus nigrolimitatus]